MLLLVFGLAVVVLVQLQPSRRIRSHHGQAGHREQRFEDVQRAIKQMRQESRETFQGSADPHSPTNRRRRGMRREAVYDL
jgi:hypothetical protein